MWHDGNSRGDDLFAHSRAGRALFVVREMRILSIPLVILGSRSIEGLKSMVYWSVYGVFCISSRFSLARRRNPFTFVMEYVSSSFWKIKNFSESMCRNWCAVCWCGSFDFLHAFGSNRIVRTESHTGVSLCFVYLLFFCPDKMYCENLNRKKNFLFKRFSILIRFLDLIKMIQFKYWSWTFWLYLHIFFRFYTSFSWLVQRLVLNCAKTIQRYIFVRNHIFFTTNNGNLTHTEHGNPKLNVHNCAKLT